MGMSVELGHRIYRKITLRECAQPKESAANITQSTHLETPPGLETTLLPSICTEMRVRKGWRLTLVDENLS